MWNFLKYTTSLLTATLSLMVKIVGLSQNVFIASSIVSTCYAYYWDLVFIISIVEI
jgi:hypothetical protein